MQRPLFRPAAGKRPVRSRPTSAATSRSVDKQLWVERSPLFNPSNPLCRNISIPTHEYRHHAPRPSPFVCTGRLPLKREGPFTASPPPQPPTPPPPAAPAAPAGPAPRAWHRPAPAARHAAAPPPAPAPAPGPIRACCAPPRRGRSARSRAPGCPGLVVDAGAGPDRLHLRWKIPVSPVVHPAVSRLEAVRGCNVPGQGGSPPAPPEPR